MSRNLRTNFLPPAPKMNSNVDKNVILIRRSLHIDKIHKNKIRSYIDITKIKMGCDWCQLPIWYDVMHNKLVICCRMKHCWEWKWGPVLCTSAEICQRLVSGVGEGYFEANFTAETGLWCGESVIFISFTVKNKKPVSLICEITLDFGKKHCLRTL